MTTNPNRGVTEDLPNPSVAEVDQREILAPSLLIHPDGPIGVHNLPSRSGPAFMQPIPASGFAKVLGPDPRRKRVTLILYSATATDTWLYSRTGVSGSGVTWPPNVPLVLEHADAVYAGGRDTSISVLTEVWAD